MFSTSLVKYLTYALEQSMTAKGYLVGNDDEIKYLRGYLAEAIFRLKDALIIASRLPVKKDAE